jgi:two-component system, NarL family, nitrate/nitrite response regulator NarL
MVTLPNLLRIAVIAEDPLARSGLVSLFGAEPDFVVVGQSGTLDDALGGHASAQIMLWDVGARVPVSLDPALFERTPTAALVRDEEAALALLRAGALGILSRSVEGARLLAALRTVAAGLVVFEPTLLGGLLSTRAASRDALLLTPREAEVLGLMAEGLSNKLIADRLKISEHTVKFHVNAILNKFDAETRTEAVVSAARRGLLML